MAQRGQQCCSWVLGILHVKGLVLGVVAPPNNTLLFIILIITNHGGPNLSNQHFSCTHATMQPCTCNHATM